MNGVRKAAMFALLSAASLNLWGCGSSYQARSVELQNATLVNPSILEKGSGDEALYRYVNPEASIKDHSKIIVDPVLITKSGELDKDELENYQKLANNAYVYLSKELAKDYQLVKDPEPGAMRVQMAIIDAEKSMPVMNTVSSVMPMAIGLNVIKLAVTGKQTGVGEITGEMKITDAETGQLIAAAVDRRVGGKAPSGVVDTWYNADEAMKYWAKRLSFVLCGMRGGSNCVKPE